MNSFKNCKVVYGELPFVQGNFFVKDGGLIDLGHGHNQVAATPELLQCPSCSVYHADPEHYCGSVAMVRMENNPIFSICWWYAMIKPNNFWPNRVVHLLQRYSTLPQQVKVRGIPIYFHKPNGWIGSDAS